MQLGELQHQITRFQSRGVKVIALSVDQAQASVSMTKRLGLSFGLASDPQQNVIKAYGVQNPSTKELAIHAVYLVNQQGEIFYRKVGGRRPLSQELIDAVDTYRGDYPRTDEVLSPRPPVAVDYPQNYFQALIAVAKVDALPSSVSDEALKQVYALSKQGRSDDALVAFKALTQASVGANEQALLDTAAWLTHKLFLADQPGAIKAGKLLNKRLARIKELEAAVLANAHQLDVKDSLQQTLGRARAGLSLTRADIRNHAQEWNLSYVKAVLRSYRAVAHAAVAVRAES